MARFSSAVALVVSKVSGGTGVSPVALRRRTPAITVLAALACTFAMSCSANAAIPNYVQVGSFPIPSSSFVFDALPDGRLIGVSATGQILRQTAVNGAAYTLVGTLPSGAVPSFGAGFAKLSPSGSRLAVGDNGAGNSICIVPLDALSIVPPTTVSTVSVFNYQAEWADDDTLYVSGSPTFGVPTSLYRARVSTGTSVEVVNQIGDGSGGVAVSAGTVYTAVGFDVSGVHDGQIRGFSASALAVAASPVAFSSSTLVGQLNTGATLDVDAQGNLIVAGGGGVGLLDPATGSTYVLPGLSPTGFYSAIFSSSGSEILVQDFGSSTVLRFAIPSPGGAALMLACGVLATRRRR